LRYCSTCGSHLELGRPPEEDRERHFCPTCGTIHYVNPKIVVGAVCTYEDRLLLCRRAIEPRTGFWTIPAGYMELGETAEEGAAREAWEEARARIAIDGLIAVYSVKRIDQVQLLYRARLLDPEVRPGPESREVRLLHWDEIPWDDLAFPTVRWVLGRALELQKDVGPLVTVGNPGARQPGPEDPPATGD
jgi:ADP-ribose pyrophosphatase YjhB (NUDIX family)